MVCVQCGGTKTAAEIRGISNDYYEHETDMYLTLSPVEYAKYKRESDAEGQEISKHLRDQWLASDLTRDEWNATNIDPTCYCDDDGHTVVYPDGHVVYE